MNDFKKFATRHMGINSMVFDDVVKMQNQYLNPYILEERQLNVTQMDVFSRLMMDRIIFLGTQIDDYTANTLQAQLLYLDSCDPGKDISIYINSPGGSVYAGLGIYDTMQFIQSDVATICTGMAASMAFILLFYLLNILVCAFGTFITDIAVKPGQQETHFRLVTSAKRTFFLIFHLVCDIKFDQSCHIPSPLPMSSNSLYLSRPILFQSPYGNDGR